MDFFKLFCYFSQCFWIFHLEVVGRGALAVEDVDGVLTPGDGDHDGGVFAFEAGAVGLEKTLGRRNGRKERMEGRKGKEERRKGGREGRRRGKGEKKGRGKKV